MWWALARMAVRADEPTQGLADPDDRAEARAVLHLLLEYLRDADDARDEWASRKLDVRPKGLAFRLIPFAAADREPIEGGESRFVEMLNEEGLLGWQLVQIVDPDPTDDRFLAVVQRDFGD
jgi:hypothetical protein